MLSLIRTSNTLLELQVIDVGLVMPVLTPFECFKKSGYTEDFYDILKRIVKGQAKAKS